MRPDSLLFSIVRIGSEESTGTGFLLDGGWVVTCAHNITNPEHIELLVCDQEGSFNIPIYAALEKCLPNGEGDLASLRIRGDLPAHARPLVLTDSSGSEGKTCRAFGFSNKGKTNGLSYNSARIDSFDSRNTAGWRQMILADADALEPGFSGSPLVESKHRILVGMVLQRGAGGLARGVPAEFIAARLGLPCAELSPYPDLIERIDRRFLLEQAHQEGPRFTAEAFYTADPPSQWWGVMIGLVARKAIYETLLQQIKDSFYGSAPILALLDGAGGMGKTTTARLLLKDLHEQFDCWWIDDTVGEDLDEILPEFLESRIQYGRDTLLLLDDWGKFSEGSKRTLLQFIRRQLKKGEAPNIRFAVTAKPDEHKDLTHDILDSHARFGFDGPKYLKVDNEQIVKTALNHLGARLTGLYDALFSPDDRLLGKPFHLLYILLRTSEDEMLHRQLSVTLHNAEGKFRQVMQYDFNRLWNDPEKKGLAVAMFFAAYLHTKHSTALTFEAFATIANHYSPYATFPPGRWLASHSTEQWGILNHYLFKREKGSYKRVDVTEFILFKKDEYADHLLYLDTPLGESVTEFLEQEKKLIVLHLLHHGGITASSILLYFFASKELLLSEKEQIFFIETFLRLNNSNPTYTNLFLGPNTLPSISFENRWSWVKKFNDFSPDNPSFHAKFITFLKREKKSQLREYINALINLGANSGEIYSVYFKGDFNVDKKSTAKRLIKESNDPNVICLCFDVLRYDPEIKKEAKRLLFEANNPSVICHCLGLLRNDLEAKKEAKRLLFEANNPSVICLCLDLLRNDSEVKKEAKRLLDTSNHPDIISKCLDLLHRDPDVKEYAKLLLKKKKQPHILRKCFDLLGDDPESKKVAKHLIRTKQSNQVVRVCLNVLRDDPEGKKVAKHLLLNNKSYLVITRCLDLLDGDDDPDVKKEARRLLNISNNQSVICRCLKALRGEPEVKAQAKRLFEMKNQHPDVLSICLQILKQYEPNWSEVTQRCLQILQNWEKEDPILVGNCLNYLPRHPQSISLMQTLIMDKWKNIVLYSNIIHYGFGRHDFWKKEVRRIIQNWRKENRRTLGSCLVHLELEPATVLDCCRQILVGWEIECITTQKRFAEKKYGTGDFYLQKALSHPHLRLLAIQSAQAMYAREQAEPGFLPYNLREVVVGIVEEGVFPAWESPQEESMENL